LSIPAEDGRVVSFVFLPTRVTINRERGRVAFPPEIRIPRAEDLLYMPFGKIGL